MDFVLVHGAGTGGWLWDGVSERLRAGGHRVWAPSLIGVGDRIDEGGPDTDLSSHVEQIHDLVTDLDPGVVLVGFSYGGLVVGIVAAHVPERVHRLVYVDAFVPRPGRSMLEALPGEVATRMQQLADDHGDGWRLAPAPLEMLGGIGRIDPEVDVDRLQALLARRGPHPLGTYREPAAPYPPFPIERTRYVSCTDKPPGDPMLRIAAAVGDAGVSVDERPATSRR